MSFRGYKLTVTILTHCTVFSNDGATLYCARVVRDCVDVVFDGLVPGSRGVTLITTPNTIARFFWILVEDVFYKIKQKTIEVLKTSHLRRIFRFGPTTMKESIFNCLQLRRCTQTI